MLASLEKLRLHMAMERSLSNPGTPGQGAFSDHPCPERPQYSLGDSETGESRNQLLPTGRAPQPTDNHPPNPQAKKQEL